MTADQQLEHRLRTACARLELVAWGTTPSYNSNGPEGKVTNAP